MKDSITKNKKDRELLYTVISVIALIALWKILSALVGKEILVPSPEATLREIIRITTSERFLLAAFNTTKRAVIGFVLALISGVILGLLAGTSKPVYYLLRPLVTMIRALPTMAIILLALIWLQSEKSPILVGFVVIFPVLYENVVQGIRNVDRRLIEMMDIYEVDRFTRLKDLYFPSISSYLKSGMSAAMGLNLKIIIAAEVLSQPRVSMGTSFQIERVNLNTPGVFAWSIITVVLAAILDRSILLFSKN